MTSRKVIKLSPTKKQWVDERKRATLVGTRLNYNAAQQYKYVAALEDMVKQMVEETNKSYLKLFKSPEAKQYFAQDSSIASLARILANHLAKKFNLLFSKKGKVLAEKMVKGAKKTSDTTLHESIKKLTGGMTLSTKVLTSTMKDVMTASVAENVALIKSIASEYQQKVQGQVMRSITTGNGLKDLIPALERYQGITERRAKNIALDQTRKAYSSLNKAGMLNVGLREFEWAHSGGGRDPREDHIAMDGQIYSFDNLPVIDQRTGTTGIPGQAPNCKCTMIPVVRFDEGQEEG